MVKPLSHSTRNSEENPKTKSVSFDPVLNEAKGRLISNGQISAPCELDAEDDAYAVDKSYDGGNPTSLDGAGILRRKRRKMMGYVQDERNGEEDVDKSYSLLYDDSTNTAPSLAPVEAFNLNEERTSGEGYFEGDTYIFRRKRKDDEDDAWLKSLNDQPQVLFLGKKASLSEDGKRDVGSDESDNSSEGPTCLEDHKLRQAQAIKEILDVLASPKETVSEAMRRLDHSCQKRSNKLTKVDGNISGNYDNNAKQKLKNLSKFANELVRMSFEHDVYSIAGEDLKRLHEELLLAASSQRQVEANERTSSSATDDGPVQWEYCAQDNKIYGPFSTDQMVQWIKQGYFLGESAVQTRKVTASMLQNSIVTKDSKKAYTREDLVADLEDSDEDHEERGKKNEWLMSDSIDFTKYM